MLTQSALTHSTNKVPLKARTAAQGLKGTHGTRNYHEALKRCECIAREEYAYAVRTLNDLKRIINRLRAQVREIARYQIHFNSAADNLKEKLEDLWHFFDIEIHDHLQYVHSSLNAKAEQLSDFTITLFGRTMAGKSTIREAITCGNGETIGKGAQRTTRDIKEYYWNHLRIIDTPGIGAFNGEDDRKLAISIVEQSDLLLFLVSSDSFQETEFRQLGAIRDKNKRVLFVLNVKFDLTKKIYRKRLLKDPGKYLKGNSVEGCIRRIKRLALEELGMRDITTVVIHAQAAFLATQCQDGDLARQLHEASGIDSLYQTLVGEIEEYGPVRRLQTFADGMIKHMEDMENILRRRSREIKSEVEHVNVKFREIDNWLDNYIGEANECIERETAKLFQPWRRSVSSFVDENIQRDDVAERWKRELKRLKKETEEFSYSMTEKIVHEIRSKIGDFAREMKVEREFRDSFRYEKVNRYDPFDTKRALKWLSTVTGAIAGIGEAALFIAGTQIWNPIGLGALFVSIVAGFISLFFDDKGKKIQKEKARVAKRLRKHLDQNKRKVVRDLKQWFYKNITCGIVYQIRNNARTYNRRMGRLVYILTDTADDLHLMTEKLNRRLLMRTGNILRVAQIKENCIGRIERDPGSRTKFIWASGFSSNYFTAQVGKALNEWILGIDQNCLEQQIADALFPARVKRSQVFLNNGRTATVKIPEDQIGKAIGPKGSNVRLAARLLGIRINIEEDKDEPQN